MMFLLRTIELCPIWLLQLCVSKNVVLYLTSFLYLQGCQFLRIITFYSTQLSSLNYHCHQGSKLATLPPVDNILQSIVIVFARTYQKYGTRRFMEQRAWLAVIAQSFLIIASRKHYIVDVVVAWLVINSKFIFRRNISSKLPDCTSALLLPGTKDSKSNEENHKLLNGNSGDPAKYV
ncbi:hypothetical protein H5410_002771 [Solanum commersonii]|uniref:Sphingomyelin synthase-like domain-containing protein n=1 Tax=Solanum commersonii TaxID=4109 RepID=A0A9J6B2V1_SOLCO|nr:hypothetical protein H5410_002771 [Solanum commersonii]